MATARSAGLSPWIARGLVLAVLLGAVLRLIWPLDIEFKGDERWTFDQVRGVLSGAPWPSLGMPTSMGVPHAALSIWFFIGLGKLFAVRTAPDLASAVQAVNVAAILGFVAFARLAIPAGDRERWYWAAALWALNPLAVVFERKIWPPSVTTPFMVALIAAWWHRRRALPAFAWGVLGAAIGQVHTGAWLLSLALVIWTLVHDRRSVNWVAWLSGSLAAAWPAIPWAVHLAHLALHDAGGMALQWRLPLLHFFIRWITQPFGLGLEYVMGPQDLRAFLSGPLIAGRPSFLMGLAALVSLLLFLAVAIASIRRVRSALGQPARDLLIGADREGVLLRAVFWGYGGLLTLVTPFGVDSHRHYLIVVAPLMALWLARVVLRGEWARFGGPRAVLAALCLAQAATSAGLLHYIHVTQRISGEYGPTWRSQQGEGSVGRTGRCDIVSGMPERGQPVLYVADLNGCSALSTMTPEALSAVFVDALERAGATIVGKVSHGFADSGMTCMLILAESHAVLHTWPETGTVNIDVFSCTARLNSLSAIEELGRAFGATAVSVRETPRANGYRPRSADGRSVHQPRE